MNWKFWQKDDDDFSLPDDFSAEDFSSSDDFSFSDSQGFSSQENDSSPDMSGSFQPPNPEPSYSPPMSQQVQQQPANQQQSGGRDLHNELLLSKLDAIKSQLDNVSARLERLEEAQRQSSQNQSSQTRGPWYAK